MNEAPRPPAPPIASCDYSLRTPRLHLRALEYGDASALWPMVSDAELTRFLAWEPHRSESETADLVATLMTAQREGKGFHWAVIHAAELVGLLSLIDVHRQHRSWTLDRAELAYWIGPSHQGRGFATEAAAAVAEFGFKELRLHKIRVYHAADNPASGKTIAKLGFRFVGEEREAFQKNGRWHHLRHFELLASELPQTPIHALRSQK